MKKIMATLNKAGIFHTVTAQGIEILKQPADMDESGKKMLKDFYGLEDFTVPSTLKDPFENKTSTLIDEGVKKASSDLSSKKHIVQKQGI